MHFDYIHPLFPTKSLPNPEPLPDFVSSFYKINPVQFVLPYLPGGTITR